MCSTPGTEAAVVKGAALARVSHLGRLQDGRQVMTGEEKLDQQQNHQPFPPWKASNQERTERVKNEK